MQLMQANLMMTSRACICIDIMTHNAIWYSKMGFRLHDNLLCMTTCLGLGSGACGWHGQHCLAQTFAQTSSAAALQLQERLPSVMLSWQTWLEWGHLG